MKLITIKNSLIGHLVVVTLVFQTPSTCKVFKAPSTCSYLCVLNTINFRIPLYLKRYILGYLCISNTINLKIPLYLKRYQFQVTFVFQMLSTWRYLYFYIWVAINMQVPFSLDRYICDALFFQRTGKKIKLTFLSFVL